MAWAIPHPANVLSNGYHTVVDLDGDGKSDFVQYDIESTSTDAAIGQTKWLLFKNTGSGFAATGTDWPIPHPANTFANGYHAVVDMNHDGLPDYVQYDVESTSTDAAIGQTEWLVFLNTGSGFSSSPLHWPIPHAANTFANGYHAVVDMDGDGLPDYVQYDLESTSTDPAIGQTKWLVFKNTGTGFASTGQDWSIPHPANVLANGYHAVLDMDGDHRPDFIQYDLESTSTDPNIGQSKWLLFRNTGSGFSSTSADWAIPHPANVLSNGYHAVLDMDGDGLPDYVQYDLESTSTDSAIGQTKWLLFKGSGAGFASAGQDWAIPHPANVLSNGYHAVLDLQPDGHVDFVQYDLESTSTDPDIGQSKWLVFPGVCHP